MGALDTAGLVFAMVALAVIYACAIVWHPASFAVVELLHISAAIEGVTPWRWVLLPPALVLFNAVVLAVAEALIKRFPLQ